MFADACEMKPNNATAADTENFMTAAGMKVKLSNVKSREKHLRNEILMKWGHYCPLIRDPASKFYSQSTSSYEHHKLGVLQVEYTSCLLTFLFDEGLRLSFR